MRLLITNLLAIALLLFGAATASATSVSMTSNYDGVSVMAPSSTVTVQVWLDAGPTDASGISVLSVGVSFDDGVLAYDQGASSTNTYLLYFSSKSPYLNALPSCGGGYGSPNAGAGCALFSPTLVNVDFASSVLPGAAPGTTGGLLATLVFHVAAAGDGVGEIGFSFAGIDGNILQYGDNSTDTPVFSGSPINVITPEPTTALLVGLGLVGLGVAGRRRA